MNRMILGRGLIVLGAISIALNTILLSLDWTAFDDRSNTQLALLAAGVLGVCLGGWLARRARSAAAALVAAVFCAALFLFAADCFAWLKSGYFFPARSRLMLRASLAVLVIAGGVLAGAALHRRRGG